MGASAPSPAYSADYTKMLPQYAQGINYGAGQLGTQTQQFQQQAGQATGQVQTNFGQYAPNNIGGFTPRLNTEFSGPNFSQGLDPLSQQLVSQAHEGAASQLANTHQALAAKYGDNPALLGILQSQASMQSQLAQNPYEFQAGVAQQDRQAQQYQLQQQAQQLTNQARQTQSDVSVQRQLQQQDASTSAAQNTNAALAQKLQMAGVPMQAQQNLLAVLSSLGALTGVKVSQPTTQTPGLYNGAGVFTNPLTGNYSA